MRGAWMARRRLRRSVSACVAGGAVLVIAACASPPDLASLTGSRSTAPTATPPASSGSHDPSGSASTSHADPTPSPEWSNTPGTDATTTGLGWIRPAGDHPGRDIVLGEDIDLTDEPGYPDIAVTVARVTRDASCPQGPSPRRGQYVALDLIVRRTTPGNDVVGLTTFEWVAVGSDGTETKTHGLSGFLCQRATDQFPLRFGDRDAVRGQLILDVPTDTVTMTATIPWDHRAARLLIPVPQQG